MLLSRVEKITPPKPLITGFAHSWTREHEIKLDILGANQKFH